MELESPRLDFPVKPKDEEVPWRWRPRQEKHRDGGNQKHEESNLDKKNKELEEKHRDGGNQTHEKEGALPPILGTKRCPFGFAWVCCFC